MTANNKTVFSRLRKGDAIHQQMPGAESDRETLITYFLTGGTPVKKESFRAFRPWLVPQNDGLFDGFAQTYRLKPNANIEITKGGRIRELQK